MSRQRSTFADSHGDETVVEASALGVILEFHVEEGGEPVLILTPAVARRLAGAIVEASREADKKRAAWEVPA